MCTIFRIWKFITSINSATRWRDFLLCLEGSIKSGRLAGGGAGGRSSRRSRARRARIRGIVDGISSRRGGTAIVDFDNHLRVIGKNLPIKYILSLESSCRRLEA